MSVPAKAKVRRMHPPSRQEIEALADVAPNPAVRAAILIAAWSGLRESEVANLNVDDVRVLPGCTLLHVRRGKGMKARDAVLLPRGVQALEEYRLTERKRLERLPLLVRANGERWGRRMSRHSIYSSFAKARVKVGMQEVWFHDLRRFYATHLLGAGVSDIDVAVALGHVDGMGRPDAALVRQVYGFVNLERTLHRVAEVMGDGQDTGAFIGAAACGVVAGERDSSVPRGDEEGGAGRAGGGVGPVVLGGSVAGDDEGWRSAAGIAAGGEGQTRQDDAQRGCVAIQDDRRVERAAADCVDEYVAEPRQRQGLYARLRAASSTSRGAVA